MYSCPSCGGNLTFEIASQKMACSYCDSRFEISQVEKEADATKQAFFDTNIFICPQCGGEIMSTENSATEYCSYCGASTILTPRISQAKRPDFIIPFQITKEECKKAYHKHIRSAIFAPNAYRKGGKIDSFRGMYVPYLSYNIKQDGPFCLNSEKTYRSGNYIITDHYKLYGELDAFYNGISYDAASNFDDSLSEAIAPFDITKKQPFTPAYLSGFYADISDIDNSLYEPDAYDFANESSKTAISQEPEFSGTGNVKWSKSEFSNGDFVNTRCKSIDQAMYPVWFMSYRNQDRVSYSVVNGQTGKVTADLPASIWKYFLGVFIIAVPLFFLLILLNFTPVPSVTLTIGCLLTLIMEGIYSNQLKQIITKERHENDLGYQSKHGNVKRNKVTPEKPKAKFTLGSSVLLIIFISIFVGGVCFLMKDVIIELVQESGLIIPMILSIIGLFMMISSLKNYSKIQDHKGLPISVFQFASLCAATIIRYFDFPSDIIYYVGFGIMIALMLLASVTIIQRNNILATRRLPQFDKKGGDDCA